MKLCWSCKICLGPPLIAFNEVEFLCENERWTDEVEMC